MRPCQQNGPHSTQDYPLAFADRRHILPCRDLIRLERAYSQAGYASGRRQKEKAGLLAFCWD